MTNKNEDTIIFNVDQYRNWLVDDRPPRTLYNPNMAKPVHSFQDRRNGIVIRKIQQNGYRK